MKYKLTPINFASVILLGLIIYLLIKPEPEGWGFLGAIFLSIFLLVGTILDFFLQNVIKEYKKIFLIEILILGLIFFFYEYNQRTKTYIIPDDFKKNYVVVIYNFDKGKKIPKSWNYEVKTDNNGLVLISSKIDSDLPETKIRTISGKNLNSKETELGYGHILSDKINCNGKIYDFEVWTIQKFCCLSTSKETKRIKDSLQSNFCK